MRLPSSLHPPRQESAAATDAGPRGPLRGFTVLEFAGLGPGPFCGMLLSDMGARVVRIDRPGGARRPRDVVSRGRESIAIDLKQPGARDVVLRLVDQADAIIEGYRPGVMERLGLGPEALHARNPRLVYGRITGWGQDGPLAKVAGHDPNYIALTGALHSIGEAGRKPVMPLNLVGDYGGGGMLLAFGILAALLEASRSGLGQVVDAAMIDGAATLMALFYGMHAAGRHSDRRGENLLDGGAHFADTYETADGKWISIAPLETPFYEQLVDALGLDQDECRGHLDPANWARLKPVFAARFRSRTRDEWCALLEGTDVCFAPVLTLAEAPLHPHNVARGTFTTHDGVVQPAPAPRFSRTPGAIAGESRAPGADTRAVLAAAGFDDAAVAALLASGAAAEPRA
jgi:alpha-methylacyl-CoA racemase